MLYGFAVNSDKAREARAFFLCICFYIKTLKSFAAFRSR